MAKVDTDLKRGDCQQAQKHIDLAHDKRRCMEGYGIVRVDREACAVFVDSQVETIDAGID